MTDTTSPPVVTGGREVKAKRTVVIALVVGGGMAATNRALGGDRPQPRLLAAGMVAAVGLTVAAEVAPRPAAAFAVLMLAVAVVDTGPQLWTALRTDVFAGTPASATSSSPNGAAGGGGSSNRGRPSDPRSPV